MLWLRWFQRPTMLQKQLRQWPWLRLKLLWSQWQRLRHRPLQSQLLPYPQNYLYLYHHLRSISCSNSWNLDLWLAVFQQGHTKTTYKASTQPDFLMLTLVQVFFGRFEKNSSSKKLKTQAKSIKTQVKIPKKPQKLPTSLEFSWRKIFKHHNFWPQLHYSIFNIWPTNLNHKTNISLLLQWLTIPSNFWSDFITALITVNWKEKLKGILVKKLKTQAKFRKKTQAKIQKNSKTANSSWDELPKKRPKKTPALCLNQVAPAAPMWPKLRNPPLNCHRSNPKGCLHLKNHSS